MLWKFGVFLIYSFNAKTVRIHIIIYAGQMVVPGNIDWQASYSYTVYRSPTTVEVGPWLAKLYLEQRDRTHKGMVTYEVIYGSSAYTGERLTVLTE